MIFLAPSPTHFTIWFIIFILLPITSMVIYESWQIIKLSVYAFECSRWLGWYFLLVCVEILEMDWHKGVEDTMKVTSSTITPEEQRVSWLSIKFHSVLITASVLCVNVCSTTNPNSCDVTGQVFLCCKAN
jgi:hypothetical protein